MKIAVIGPGAMGCLLAATLSQSNKVWLLDHDPERANFLHRRGLVLEENGQARKCRVDVTCNAHLIGPVDLILLCVKSGKVQEALQSIKPLCHQKSLLLALQNGIGHLPLLPKMLGDTTWGLGVTSHGATLAGSGHVLHKGQGLTLVGLLPELIGRNSAAKEQLVLVAQTLTSAGIETEPVVDILNHVWAKLLVNVGINALTAIHNCPNGALLKSAEVMAMMEAAVLEGQAVAKKIGIILVDDPLQATREVCRATAANISSMLQDVRAKRPTEIDAINGALILRGAEFAIPMVANEELVRKVKGIESKYDDFT